MKLRISIALILFISSHNVLSADKPFTDFYFGIGLGQTSGSFVDNELSIEINGGLNLNENFSAELSFLNLGDEEFLGDLSLSVSGFTLSTVGKFPLTDEINLLASIGLYSWGLAFTDDEGDRSEDLVDGNDLIYGVGFDFSISESFNIVTQYRRVNLGDLDEDQSNLTLSVIYNI